LLAAAAAETPGRMQDFPPEKGAVAAAVQEDTVVLLRGKTLGEVRPLKAE
jgi:hypothetical protein